MVQKAPQQRQLLCDAPSANVVPVKRQALRHVGAALVMCREFRLQAALRSSVKADVEAWNADSPSVATRRLDLGGAWTSRSKGIGDMRRSAGMCRAACRACHQSLRMAGVLGSTLPGI